MKLYPDQVVALNRVAEAVRSEFKRIVLKLPTGGGKTVIAARMIQGALAKGNRVAFIVDAISLIDQTVDRFIEFGIPEGKIGVIQGLHERTDLRRPVQIISIDTLRKRRDLLTSPLFANNLRLVLYDECHAQIEFIYEWMGRWNNVLFVGLSATPWAHGMAKHWQTMVIAGTIRELISIGRLSQYRFFAVSHPDLSKVKVRAGDYVENELAEVMSKGAIISNAVEHWLKHGEGRPTLAFCVNRLHAQKVQQDFISRGIPCGYIDAFTDLDERAEIGRQFHSGELKAVASVGCLTKGVDWDVRCILMLRPTKSEMLYIQIIGRGLRVAEGKDYCLILDHSDNGMRLGFPEDVDEKHTHLSDKNKKEQSERVVEPPLPKPCPQCKMLKPPKTPICPFCGFHSKPQYEGNEIDGELEELVPAEKRAINRKTSKEEKGAFYAGLKMHGQRKGYKDGWAANQYKEKFGVWPNAYKNVEPMEPNDMVRGWLKHRAIKYRAGQVKKR